MKALIKTLIAAFSAAACAAATAAPTASWDKASWIDRTAYLLRGHNGLGASDDLTKLMSMSEEQIAREFMKDSRFGDTVLDFNMFFLGYKHDQLRKDNYYFEHAFDFGNAVSSTQALLNNGDYLKLFDLEGNYFQPPLPDEKEAIKTRNKVLNHTQVLYTWLVGAVRGRSDAKKVCEHLGTFDDKLQDFLKSTQFYEYAFGKNADDYLFPRTSLYGGYEDSPLGRLQTAQCDTNDGKNANAAQLIEAINKQAANYARFVRELKKFEPKKYAPKTVAEFKAFDISMFPQLNGKWVQFGHEQSAGLGNSSTNANRKRGAYVLKHFFCDDLTPVGFEDPQEHMRVQGQHGSTTSCFACHYKLDPMAGFFRDLGYYFRNYSTYPTITFDDLVTKNRSEYQDTHWKSQNTNRRWNVGYVRSSGSETGNNYGETLSDLSKIIRGAPEAKRCLMRKLFDYMVADNQNIDAGYLDHLTREFEKEAAVNSSVAIKNAMVRILKSRAFKESNIDANQCYDQEPGTNVQNAPPCKVAAILRRNCVKCHDNENDYSTGLNLNKWIKAPDGVNYTFPHLDDTFIDQRSAQESLTRIAARLSTNDPKRRMPRNATMPAQERQELYLWTQQELQRLQRSTAK